MIWGFVGVLVAIALCARLIYAFNRSRQRKAKEQDLLFAGLRDLIQNPVFEAQGPNQFPKLKGAYKDFPIQIHPVVDTLATRRLPALWLLVTVQDRLPLKARFNMMMRPAGPSTFSNFDHLPVTLKHPEGFPEHAVIRTDDPGDVLPAEIVKPHIGAFFGNRAKELLITENGLRIVWLLAEADRARYGVFRQADFGEIEIDPETVQDILDTLLGLRLDILAWNEQKK